MQIYNEKTKHKWHRKFERYIRCEHVEIFKCGYKLQNKFYPTFINSWVSLRSSLLQTYRARTESPKPPSSTHHPMQKHCSSNNCSHRVQGPTFTSQGHFQTGLHSSQSPYFWKLNIRQGTIFLSCSLFL